MGGSPPRNPSASLPLPSPSTPPPRRKLQGEALTVDGRQRGSLACRGGASGLSARLVVVVVLGLVCAPPSFSPPALCRWWLPRCWSRRRGLERLRGGSGGESRSPIWALSGPDLGRSPGRAAPARRGFAGVVVRLGSVLPAAVDCLRARSGSSGPIWARSGPVWVWCGPWHRRWVAPGAGRCCLGGLLCRSPLLLGYQHGAVVDGRSAFRGCPGEACAGRRLPVLASPS
jgi:hypothetical protein